MINHIRTLLLNRDATRTDADHFAHEYVPDWYRAVRLPSQLEGLRRTLFGTAPDAAGMNYRLRQFTPFLHAPDALPYTLGPDVRVTYLPDISIFGLTHRPAITQLPNTLATVVGPSGPLLAPTGRLWHEIDVTLVPLVDYDAADDDLGNMTVPLEYCTPSGPTLMAIPGIPEMQLRIAGTGLSAGDRLKITLLRRPAAPLAAIPAQLQPLVTPEVAALLFGYTSDHFAVFRSWWESDRLGQQLAGLLLALAYRTDAIRQGGR